MPPRRVLIIDDDDDIREVAAVVFDLAGHYEVTAAASGSAGILLALEGRPDVILLDVMMPEMDGPATFARLQESDVTRTIPVVFLTAKIQPADRRRLSDLGAHGIIAKPFDPTRLAGEVAAIVGW